MLNEPSVVAIERSTHRVLAVGHEAKQMINHTPDAFFGGASVARWRYRRLRRDRSYAFGLYQQGH